MKAATCTLLLISLSIPSEALADPVQVGVQTMGDNLFRITLQTPIAAAQESVWTLLTDYDHHAGFLPYMTQSQIVATEGESQLIEQEGGIRILFWTFKMRVKQRVWEDAPSHMHFMAIEGDFDQLQGDFRLSVPSALSFQTILACDFTVKPKRRVPDWAVRMAAKHYLRKMVHVLAEKAENHSP